MPDTVSHVTRIAPSPTGLFHIGSARTALYNWLVARSTGGKFILRIDDTDVARNTPEAVGVIDAALDWLGLGHDLRFRQSDRLDHYRAVAAAMVDAGMARRDGEAVRFCLRDPLDGWTDTVSGNIRVSGEEKAVVDGLVLMRSDGMPTYHFASVVDDMDTGVTWVIRGMDHLSNTAKHVAIWTALQGMDWSGGGRPLPLWTHVGLITKDGKKVAKRDGASSLLAYRDAGFDPDAMSNWLLRLGWGPTVDDRTVKTISRDRALELFLSGGRMRPSPANMDQKLLDSLDRKYKGSRERAARAAADVSPPSGPG